MDGKGLSLVIKTVAEIILKTRFKNILHMAAFLALFTPTYATYKLLENPEKFSNLLLKYYEQDYYILDIVDGCTTFKLRLNDEEKLGTFYTTQENPPTYVIKFYRESKSYPELVETCRLLKDAVKSK